MRNKLGALIMLLFSSCSQPEYMPHCKEKVCNEITQKVADQMLKEKELYAIGSGGRAMYEVKMLALSFRYYKHVDINKVRELLVFSANRFANEVNKDKRIHTYLYLYPFKPQNIQIIIFLHEPDGRDVPQGNLSSASIINGILEYDVNEPGTGYLKTIYKETYEEAVQKLGELEEHLVVPPFAPDPSGGRVYNPSKKLTNKAQAST